VVSYWTNDTWSSLPLKLLIYCSTGIFGTFGVFGIFGLATCFGLDIIGAFDVFGFCILKLLFYFVYFLGVWRRCNITQKVCVVSDWFNIG
jgi:hypothetical protein